MAITVNGYKVLFDNRTTGTFPRLRKWVIPGTGRYLLLRDGVLGFVLIHFALWYHEKIERLNASGSQWDEWGWAVRPVRGQSTGYSNHAGGVAMDLNATKHPRGVLITRTMSRIKIAQIKLRLKVYRGVIVWGAGWRTPDGMHYEIAPNSYTATKRLARYLATTSRGKRILVANPGAKAIVL